MIKTIWTDTIDSPIYQDALAIRYKVFVDEQEVPADLEIDDLEEVSRHLVLYQANQAIATARMYEVAEHIYKVQRVAVLNEYRRKGLGAELMKAIETKAKRLNARKLILGSQNTAIPFYEKLGYQISSAEFMDAGIPHHSMTKFLID